MGPARFISVRSFWTFPPTIDMACAVRRGRRAIRRDQQQQAGLVYKESFTSVNPDANVPLNDGALGDNSRLASRAAN
jgi:hypothetical protein